MTNMINLPWYCIVLYIAIGTLVLGIFDKYKIIKSKTLRYFIVIFVYSVIFGFLCNLAFSPQ